MSAAIPQPEDLPTVPGSPPRLPGDPRVAEAFSHDLAEGRYEIHASELGRGGIGRVLLATDKALRREVALKTLLEHAVCGNEERFIREARITGRLEHPGIVPVHDIAIDPAGRVFYTMKRVCGTTLRTVLDSLKAEEADAQRREFCARFGSLGALLTVFQKVCDAVAFAHGHPLRVIHRDLKPDNIMLGDYGEVLVMDWGLAKVMGDPGELHGDGLTEEADPRAETPPRESPTPATPSTPAGTPSIGFSGLTTIPHCAVGTPGYAAPEQVEGRSEAVDERADVYALGAILYEIMTLHPPAELSDDDAAVVASASADEKPAVAAGILIERTRSGEVARRLKDGRARSAKAWHCPNGMVPRSLAPVALRALARQPRDRLASVKQLQEEVAAYQNGFATRAENASALRSFLYFVRRHKAAAVALLAITMTLIGATFVSVRWAQQAEKERRTAEQARDAAEDIIAESVVGMRTKLMPFGKIGILDDTVVAAEAYFQRLPASLVTPATEQHRASLLFNKGIIALGKGQVAEGRMNVEKALHLIDKIEAAGGGSEELQKEAALSGVLYAMACWNRADYPAMRDACETVHARCQRWLKIHPKSEWALGASVLEACVAALGLARGEGKPLEALPRYLEATGYAEKLKQVAGETADYHAANGMIAYGGALAALTMKARADEVTTRFETAAASLGKALGLGASSSLLAEIYRDLRLGALNHAGKERVTRGLKSGDQSEIERGKAMVREAFAERKRLLEWDPSRVEWWRDLASSHAALSQFAEKEGDLPSALAEQLEAVGCSEKVVALSPERAVNHYLLASRLRVAARLRSQLLNPDFNEALALAGRGVMAWLDGGRLGPAGPGESTLRAHVDGFLAILERARVQLPEARIAAVFDEVGKILRRGAQELPGDPLVLSACTTFGEAHTDFLIRQGGLREVREALLEVIAAHAVAPQGQDGMSKATLEFCEVITDQLRDAYYSAARALKDEAARAVALQAALDVLDRLLAMIEAKRLAGDTLGRASLAAGIAYWTTMRFQAVVAPGSLHTTYEKAAEIVRTAEARVTEPTMRERLGAALGNVELKAGESFLAAKHAGTAREHFRKAAEIHDRLRAARDLREYHDDAGSAWERLGWIAREEQGWAEARRCWLEALERRRRASELDPKSVERRRELLSIRLALFSLPGAEDPASDASALEDLIAQQTSLLAEKLSHTQLDYLDKRWRWSLDRLSAEEHRALAVRVVQASADLQRRVLSLNPQNTALRWKFAATLRGLAKRLLELGRPWEAEEKLLECVKLAEPVDLVASPEEIEGVRGIMDAWTELAQMSVATEDWTEAKSRVRERQALVAKLPPAATIAPLPENLRKVLE
jgi:serine/threonine protein kinase